MNFLSNYWTLQSVIKGLQRALGQSQGSAGAVAAGVEDI